ncbi:helix-turn-helix domain-containing protein [Abiotrophia defectiva]|uniref:helix-turn-helix domain-containing protein n=1 Tax=Abiotrophia defectiva TaxID=46125 RepID=UPI0037BF9FB4
MSFAEVITDKVTKFIRNENVTATFVEKICKTLECNLDGIMEIDDKEMERFCGNRT